MLAEQQDTALSPVEAHGSGSRTQSTPDSTASMPTGGSRRYAVAVCVFASLGGLFFGYDQGVTGGVLVMDSFLDDFCIDYGKNSAERCHAQAHHLPVNWLAFTTLYNVTYYLGCIFGALLGGYVADRCGRRVTVFTAALLFSVGTLWVILTPAQAHTAVLVGRVVEGLGVGNSSFSLPLFGAEMAPKELRGLLSGFMQMTVVTGLLVANVVNLAVENAPEGWRLTNGVAVVAPLVVMLGIFCVPESPRWVYQHRGRALAGETLQKLRQTENITRELDAIGEQVALEKGTDEDGNTGSGTGSAVLISSAVASSWRGLWRVKSVRRRLLIAMALQLLQQATGINPVFTYGGQIFKDVAGDGILSLLVLTGVNFLSTIPAMRWVDTCGRRQLLLMGAPGMFLGHLISALGFTVGCHGDTQSSGCSTAAGYVIVAAAAFFVFNFAISWGPVCWIYPAEIFPLSVRARAVSISTMTNWAMGALMIGAPQLFPFLNVNGVFFLFAVLCAVCGIFVYCMCPETKGILLEDIEVLFDKSIGDPKEVVERSQTSQTGGEIHAVSLTYMAAKTPPSILDCRHIQDKA